MHASRFLAVPLALAATLCSCQGESTTSEDSSEMGAIQIEGGATDTPSVTIPPTDTPVVVPPRHDSDGCYLVPGFDSSFARRPATVLQSWRDGMGLFVRVALAGRNLAPAGILDWSASSCSKGDADTTCRSDRLRIVGRQGDGEHVASDTATHVFDVLIGTTPAIDASSPLTIVDDQGHSLRVEGTREEPAKCERTADARFVVCRDAAGSSRRLFDPFPRD